MPEDPSLEPAGSGICIGDVDGHLRISAGGDIIGRDQITHYHTTVQVSVEAVTQSPLVAASPYRGLDPFRDLDKDFYFGREELVVNLLAHVEKNNVLIVLGASGSGKSSVVRAGLLPALSHRLGGQFRYFAFVPDENPFLSAGSSLQGAGFTQLQTRELLTDVSGHALQAFIRKFQGSGEEWLIFIDQLEELFTLTEETLRRVFIDSLLDLARGGAGSTKIVLTMRADFLDCLGPYPEFAKLIEKNIHLVADMHADELRLAIEQPAARHGVVFERGLVEEIIHDVQGQAGSLPLLQYTLDVLWKEERHLDGLQGRHLKTHTYRELGGVRGALQKRADDLYRSLGKTGNGSRQETFRRILLRLVDLVGEEASEAGWRPIRRRVAMASFSGEEQVVLALLIDSKLLVSDREGTEATVEVAHEAIFTSWQRLKQWIEGGKQVLFARNRLSDDARRWESRTRQGAPEAQDELLHGFRLAQSIEMRQRGDFASIAGGLNDLETRFLDASADQRNLRLAQEKQRAQRERDAELRQLRLQRRLVWAFSGIAIIAVLGACAFAWAAKRAEAARSDADDLNQFLVGGLREKLQDIGRLDVLDDAAREADKYLAKAGQDIAVFENGSAAHLSAYLQLACNLAKLRLAQGRLREAIASVDAGLGLLRKHPADPALAMAHAQLLDARCDILDRTMENADGQRAGREALGLLANLDGAEAALLRSDVYTNLADLQKQTRDYVGAEASVAQAIALCAPLAVPAASGTARHALLNACLRQINLRLESGNLAAARTAGENRLALSEQYSQEGNLSPPWELESVRGHDRLTEVYLRLNQIDLAKVEAGKTLDAWSKLLRSDPYNREWMRGQAVGCTRMGRVMLAAGDPRGAFDAFYDALQIDTRLCTAAPDNLIWKAGRAKALSLLGSALFSLQHSTVPIDPPLPSDTHPNPRDYDEEALKLRRELYRDPSGTLVAENTRDLIKSLIHLSGDDPFAPSEKPALEAVAVAQKINGNPNAAPDDRALFAGACENLGEYYVGQSRADDGQHWYEAALPVRIRFALDFPADYSGSCDLAKCQIDLAGIHKDRAVSAAARRDGETVRREGELARPLYQSASERLRKLDEDFPRDPRCRELLLQCEKETTELDRTSGKSLESEVNH